jgi:hypothetical protein
MWLVAQFPAPLKNAQFPAPLKDAQFPAPLENRGASAQVR